MARPADLAAIRDLFREMDRFHAAGEPALLRVPPVPRFSASELDELSACKTCFLAVAVVAGEVVGFVDASIRGPEDTTDRDVPWCSVNNLAVTERRRREGIGRQLTEATEAWAREKGVADVRLNVFAFNADARVFYEQRGYRVVSLQLHKALDALRESTRDPGG